MGLIQAYWLPEPTGRKKDFSEKGQNKNRHMVIKFIQTGKMTVDRTQRLRA